MTVRPYALALAAAFTVAASAAPPPGQYRAPRTESGQPDLRGVWNFSSDVPLERPVSVANRRFFTRQEYEAQRTMTDRGLQAVAKLAPVENVGLLLMDHVAHVEDLRTSLISSPANGRLPPLVDGVRRLVSPERILAALANPTVPPPPEVLSAFGSGGTMDSVEDFSAWARCIVPQSLPLLPDLDNNYVQILQSADSVALLTDISRRIVPLDGRPHVSPKLASWVGDSRGHWDGDTLVIETTSFNDHTRSFSGAGTSGHKVVTERITRQSAGILSYEATVVDPKTFQDKVVVSFPMAKTGSRIYENACHEHNYSMSNTLSAARAAERAASVHDGPGR